ncbi:MAG: histidine kinase, partial [Chitinophagaceae bacterium]
MNESYIVPLFLGTTILAALMLIFVMGVLFVQKNKQNKFKRKVLEARLEEQEKTLNEISRNLHDDVAQLLSHIQMNLNHLDSLNIKETKSAIVSATDFLREAMMDVRHMSHTLNSDWLRSRGLINAITDDIEHINATNQVHCAIVLEGEEYRMKHELELPIFRITQEVINNMFKHSKASKFVARLDYRPD